MPNKKALLHASFWTAAAVVGCAAVLYAKLIAAVQSFYFECFQNHSYLVSALTPFLFLGAAAIVRLWGPEAKGSGIPQVLEAIELAKRPDPTRVIWVHQLVSVKTAVLKILSSTVGTLAGASIGREGPTVQIASSIFAWVGDRVRKIHPGTDFPSFVTAGAAAGVAAAFNTPLAGITFAIEEISEGSFGPFKQLVLVAVVIAGITAQAIAGDYLYFGHPAILESSRWGVLPEAVAIGIISGGLGGLFAKLLAQIHVLPLPRSWAARAFYCGIVCSVIGLLCAGATAGSGYEVTRDSLEANALAGPTLLFPLLKFITTLFSYLSGMAGGIFSPCLSIGSGIGFAFATLAHLSNLKACALIGMVGFFSGVIQAPLTAVVIVMEMTDQRTLVLPFILAAFISQGVGKLMMPVPLYRYLSNSKAPA